MCDRASGEPPAARACYIRDLDDQAGPARALSQLGTVYESLKRFADATMTLHQALLLHQEIGDRERIGVLVEAYNQARYQHDFEAVRSALGGDSFNREFALGRRLDIEAAIECAEQRPATA